MLALTMAIVDFVLVVPEVEGVVLAMNILANIALIGRLLYVYVLSAYHF